MSSVKPRNKIKIMNGNTTGCCYGYSKSDIKTVRKNGQKKYIWKGKSKNAKKNFSNWNTAVKQAKRNLGFPVKGPGSFILLNVGVDGRELYREASTLYYGSC